MTSFTSLLNSIGGKKLEAPHTKPGLAKLPATTNEARTATGNVVAGVKRKPEEQATAPNAKMVKVEVKVPVGSVTQINGQPSAPKPAPSTYSSAAPYRGTARPAAGASNSPNPVTKPAPRLGTATSTSARPAAHGTSKPKKGFAAILERAKAAQEAAKAAGSSTIKHKPVEKLTKRDRMRQEEAAKQQKAAGGKVGKRAVAVRSRSGTPIDTHGAVAKKAESTYKGTMKKLEKKPVERQEFTYKGTMRKNGPGAPQAKPTAKKGMAQDKYGGYASWSDLDEAEDQEGEDYESDASSDVMDAGFDDMEKEDRMALAAAKKEDQEALAEEERHKREKLERKKKLEALSKSAAAAKKKY
ncbi:hypothetical protein DOTSEDRAFT_41172 [Dothistroma septosporum NZE10]|uniref:SPT2 chromatin protein n=1 Tax=Dothistroma septosporum (strain NZE10 / CBS 128990) TaxID=675120 RepID=N1Q4Y7_DOTSN|nr:hypothetical protein DOTSEDRAFT_41172 [Dothistroma septosporum NZE10]